MFKPGSFRTLALGVSLLAAAVPASARADPQIVSGNASLTVSVPDVIILDYFTSINLTQCAVVENQEHSISPLSILGIDESTPEQKVAPASGYSPGKRSASFNAPDVTVTMKNVWAVRGFSTRGNATVSAIGPATSGIGVSNRQVSASGALDLASGNTISTSLNGIRQENATTGDVLMSRNFACNSGFFTIMLLTL
jgi:hypothetical protein